MAAGPLAAGAEVPVVGDGPFSVSRWRQDRHWHWAQIAAPEAGGDSVSYGVELLNQSLYLA